MSKCLVDPRSLLQFDFGDHHPFKIYRLGLTFELMADYGLVDADEVTLLEPRLATDEEALRFHSQGYLETLRLASSGMWVPNLFSHGLGTSDNPVFPDVFDWGMLVAGASIDCARLLVNGEARRAFNFAGGLHHAMPSRASGFCHINDAALAIAEMVARGKRVAYVDIDAHHGDGVQHAFYASSEVLTISIHQTGYTIFPGSGFVEERGENAGEGYCVNVPLLPGAGDAAYDRAFERIILPAIRAFSPDVLVTQLGADAILGDIVANLRMSLVQYERCITEFRTLDLPWLALGGGGYAIENVVRAWTLAWGIQTERTLPDDLPASWLTRAAPYGLRISRLRGTGEPTPTSQEAALDLEQTIERLEQSVLPILSNAS